jgi:hypothetical protein
MPIHMFQLIEVLIDKEKSKIYKKNSKIKEEVNKKISKKKKE